MGRFSRDLRRPIASECCKAIRNLTFEVGLFGSSSSLSPRTNCLIPGRLAADAANTKYTGVACQYPTLFNTPSISCDRRRYLWFKAHYLAVLKLLANIVQDWLEVLCISLSKMKACARCARSPPNGPSRKNQGGMRGSRWYPFRLCLVDVFCFLYQLQYGCLVRPFLFFLSLSLSPSSPLMRASKHRLQHSSGPRGTTYKGIPAYIVWATFVPTTHLTYESPALISLLIRAPSRGGLSIRHYLFCCCTLHILQSGTINCCR